MLEARPDLVPTSQVEQEGQGVDVCSPSQKHCQLRHAEKSRSRHTDKQLR